MRPIARIRTPFPDKFGVPRQSGLAPSLEGRIVFLPEFRSPEALRGIGQFSHLWLLWQFSLPERCNILCLHGRSFRIPLRGSL
ncbi:MAG: SAM-dependent methyltransferase [Clostridia bacterium]|nr:SAM-dependent methyltransferase [Clostridia bacterium]